MSRKLLLHIPIPSQPPSLPPSAAAAATGSSFDANALVVLSVLVCALICSLALNYIIRFMLGSCTYFLRGNSSAKLPSIGINPKALKTFPIVKYNAEQPAGLDSECVICLSEFGSGERVRILPKCNHGFHVICIDRWLKSHSSCPTCRQCLIKTCQKIVDCSQTTRSSDQLQQSIVNIMPLEPEGIITNRREVTVAIQFMETVSPTIS
ncbi:RING-H2 finger protein ATL78-like [Tripterygium wilfordii]|uniref:RING-type E3 ubiquitin transferase n=1 Tax=Tripterygium wilfordii TaxID=458696 RepID=A0A7J7DZI5_TRIWF|nr:RING-H2 finger protein ATL78-like [Tripterygium wilfordii]KAF5751810.1 RING-H2 finger protein ATL78-like [Tripterygium wilfordii]